mmetsp:Transcript_385/g.660  ORF Transcript_385/g.660 Transcript_385/m.660 type:complete len:754 (+) Transcript_385:108-2369(+)
MAMPNKYDNSSIIMNLSNFPTIPIASCQSIPPSTSNPPSVLINLGTIHNRVSQPTAKRTTSGPSSSSVSTLSTISGIFERIIHDHQHGRYALMCLFEQMFEIEESGFLAGFVDECGGNSGFSAAARTAYAVDVVFNFAGHVEVDYVLNVGKIQSLRGHICCHQNILLPLLIQFNRLISLLLIFPPMNTHRFHPLQEQILVNIIHISLLLTKNDHWRRRLLQTLQQIHDLRLLLHVLHLLNDIQIRRPRPPHIDHDGPHQSLLGKILKLLGKSGRIQNGLPLMMEMIHDFSDFLVEPQIEHAIRLIEAHVAADIEGDGSFFQKVAETARSGDDAVDSPVAKGLKLISSRFSSDEELGTQRGIRFGVVLGEGGAEFRNHLEGLAGQLPGGSQDDAHRSFSGDQGHSRLFLQGGHDEGQGKAEGFAAPREGDADHVPSREGHGESLHLDGGGSFDVLFLEGAEHGRGEGHVFEAADGRGDVVAFHEYVPLLSDFVPFAFALAEDGFGTAPGGGEGGFVFDAFGEFGGSLEGVGLDVGGFFEDALFVLLALEGGAFLGGELRVTGFQEGCLLQEGGGVSAGGFGGIGVCIGFVACVVDFFFFFHFFVAAIFVVDLVGLFFISVTATAIFVSVCPIILLRFHRPTAATATHGSQSPPRKRRPHPRVGHSFLQSALPGPVAPIDTFRRVLLRTQQSQSLFSLQSQTFGGRHDHAATARGGFVASREQCPKGVVVVVVVAFLTASPSFQTPFFRAAGGML